MSHTARVCQQPLDDDTRTFAYADVALSTGGPCAAAPTNAGVPCVSPNGSATGRSGAPPRNAAARS